MQIKLVSRTGTGAFFGALAGIYNHHSYLKWNGLGRTAYLNYQGSRFDRFMTNPKPETFDILGGVVVVVILVGLYELVVAGISKLLKATD
jgi:hypothetical protein